jgi:WD40 repeat protein
VVDRPRALVPFEESAVGAISAEGERWIALGPDPRTGRLSWLTGAFDAGQVRPVDGFQPTGSAPELSHDGRWVAWGNWQGRNAHARALAEKAPVVEFPVPGSANVTFTPDAQHLMVAGPEDLRLYEVGTWRQVYAVSRRPPGASAPNVAFSSDSRLGAVTLTGRVMLFDAASGQEVASLPAGGHVLTRLAFSPDDRVLGVAASDHRVLLWDLTRLRQQLRTLHLDWD